MDVFSFKKGNSPLLISMPHSGEHLPDDVAMRMTDIGRELIDTDWHIPKLYDFAAQLDATILQANYSRYVVDLNRPIDSQPLYPGQRETGVCSTTTFMDQEIYLEGEAPNSEEIEKRVAEYWQPYHAKLRAELGRIRDQYGFAILWDAHSIQSQLPRFFDGKLPDLNMGTVNGISSSLELAVLVNTVLEQSHYDVISNGRFKGGYITRNYGDPANGIHAIQMEIAQISYMTEYPEFIFDEEKANKLRPVLQNALQSLIHFFDKT